MANDKLFHKRKAREKKENERKRKQRKEKPLYLIVTEGETEEAYFNLLKSQNDSIASEVTCDCGTSPKCVVTYALEKEQSDGPYDKIFAVFDGDILNQSNFDEAIQLVEQSRTQGLKIWAIQSTPCFEYWILLHFRYSRQPFKGIRKSKSAGTQILTELRKQKGMASYEKGAKPNIPAFIGKTEIAIENAEKSIADAKKDGERNPSTNVHVLVKALKKGST